MTFTFGIPLISREGARNWHRVQSLLGLTLSSLLAQTDQDFQVVVAGHDCPRCVLQDPRISFLEAAWPADAPDVNNHDGGRKKQAISDLVRQRGGGFLMFVDADDWVDVRLVEVARRQLGPGRVGAVIPRGYATDLRTLRSAPFPCERLYDRGFDTLCGTSTVLRLEPDSPDPLLRDPYSRLHEHYKFIDTARRNGHEVLKLPVEGNYVVNTSENHSELHGPYAEWRNRFTRGVNELGNELTPAQAARFGLGLDQIRRVSQSMFCAV